MATIEFGTLDGDVLITGTAERPATYSDEPDATDTLAYYRFASNQSWKDQSGNGKTLDIIGGAPTLGPGGATFVRANSDYRRNTTIPSQGLGNLTVEMWINLASLPGAGATHEAFGWGIWNLRLHVREQGGDYFLRVRSNEDDGLGGSVIQAAEYDWTATIATGTWHHVATTWDQGVALRLWLDGVNVASDLTLTGNDLSSADTNFYVGASSSGNNFDGIIDQVRLSDALRYMATFAPVRTTVVGGRIEIPSDLTISNGVTLAQQACGELALDPDEGIINNLGGALLNFDGLLLNTLE